MIYFYLGRFPVDNCKRNVLQNPEKFTDLHFKVPLGTEDERPNTTAGASRIQETHAKKYFNSDQFNSMVSWTIFIV